jgi:hypothetical protein
MSLSGFSVSMLLATAIYLKSHQISQQHDMTSVNSHSVTLHSKHNFINNGISLKLISASRFGQSMFANLPASIPKVLQFSRM